MVNLVIKAAVRFDLLRNTVVIVTAIVAVIPITAKK